MSDTTPTTVPAAAAPPVNLDLDDQVATDVATLATLTREIKERTERAEEIKAALRDRLAGGHRYRYQGREVLDLAEPGQQFDAKAAAAVVPAPLLAQISVPKPDADLARRILPPALYAQCCKAKAPAVKTL